MPRKCFSLSLFRRKVYPSCIVFHQECFSRLQWYVSRFRARTWIAISRDVAVWKGTFLFQRLPCSISTTCSPRPKRLARTLRRRNRRYIPPANGRKTSRQIPRTAGGPRYRVYCPTSFHFATALFVVQTYGRHRSGNTNEINAFQVGWKPLILVSSWEYCLLIRFLFKIPLISTLRRFHHSRHSSRP